MDCPEQRAVIQALPGVEGCSHCPTDGIGRHSRKWKQPGAKCIGGDGMSRNSILMVVVQFCTENTEVKNAMVSGLYHNKTTKNFKRHALWSEDANLVTCSLSRQHQHDERWGFSPSGGGEAGRFPGLQFTLSTLHTGSLGH